MSHRSLLAVFWVLVLAQPSYSQVLNSEALPVPAPRTEFNVPESDPAGRAARLIARSVPTFRNYRAEIRLATWVHDDRAVWSIRATEDCYSALTARGVSYERIPAPSPLVASPVRILGSVEGVDYGRLRISCELALRLPVLSQVLSRNGLVRAHVISDYRREPRTSFHTMGLALDISAFFDAAGRRYRVQEDYLETPSVRTCQGSGPLQDKAQVLRRVACELFETGSFSSILTPNYNQGHRDHFHIDARPDDPRLFLR